MELNGLCYQAFARKRGHPHLKFLRPKNKKPVMLEAKPAENFEWPFSDLYNVAASQLTKSPPVPATFLGAAWGCVEFRRVRRQGRPRLRAAAALWPA
jgi:hypothetical protein